MPAAALTEEEHDALQSGLGLAAAMAGGARPLSAAQVQALYDGMRGKEGVAQALGVVGLAFGELILPQGPFEWVRVSDEHGTETCIGVKELDLFCYPISMIEKRLKQDEAIEVEMLARQTAAELKKLAEAGSAKPRQAG